MSTWSLLLFIWWLLKEPFGLLDVQRRYLFLYFFLVALAFLTTTDFLTSFFVLAFFAATFGFAGDFVTDGFLTAGFLDEFFLDDGLFGEDFFLEDVSFSGAGFFVETFFVAAGFFGLATGFLLGAAGFLGAGFFCSFDSLNDPDAPTPFVWTKVPLLEPFFRAVLMCWDAVSPTLKLALMYFSIAWREEPLRSFSVRIAVVIISSYFGCSAGF